MPTMDSSTWWPTPARCPAARRLRVPVPKNSTISASFCVGVLLASITAATPASAASSPSPDCTSTPADRLMGTTS